jgi:hypothetical protein
MNITKILTQYFESCNKKEVVLNKIENQFDPVDSVDALVYNFAIGSDVVLLAKVKIVKDSVMVDVYDYVEDEECQFLDKFFIT